MCNCYYYDRAVDISIAEDMRTLFDRKNCSSSSNGQVAAHRVTGLQKALAAALNNSRQNGPHIALTGVKEIPVAVCSLKAWYYMESDDGQGTTLVYTTVA